MPAFEGSTGIDAQHGIFTDIHTAVHITINLNDSAADPPPNRRKQRLALIKTDLGLDHRPRIPPPEILIEIERPLPTLPENKTIFESDGGTRVSTSNAQMETMEYSSTSHTSSASMSSGSLRSAVSNEQCLCQFNAQDGSIQAATLEGLIEQLITYFGELVYKPAIYLADSQPCHRFPQGCEI